MSRCVKPFALRNSFRRSAEGTIHYTVDGTEPNENSPVYTEPLTVTDIATIRAYAVKDGRSSGFVSFCYTTMSH